MEHNDNPSWGVGGVVLRDGEILLVRHTYGSAKGQLLFPGGFVQNGEMPEAAVVREILEETGVTASVKSLIGIRFQVKNWYAMYLLDYVSGESKSDENENNLAAFYPLGEAAGRDDITNLTRLMINSILNGVAEIPLNDYYSGENRNEYMLYGLTGRKT